MLKNFFEAAAASCLISFFFLREGKPKIFILQFQKYINTKIIYQPHWMDKSKMPGKAIWCLLLLAFRRDTFLL